MRVRQMRWLVTGALAVAVVATTGAAATAATTPPYPAGAPTCSVTPDPVFTDSTVTFSCTGFAPGATVVITSSGSGRVTTSPATARTPGASEARADASGGFSVAEAVTVVGTATFTATGQVPGGATGSGSARTQVIARSTPAPNARTQVGAVSDSRPAAGQPFTVSGCGYTPGSSVAVTDTAGDSFGSATVGSDGCFHKSITFDSPGCRTITATGTASDGAALTTTRSVCVLAAVVTRGTGAGSGTGLAFTGADGIGVMLLAGGALVGGGSALVARSRRRRTYSTV